MSTGGVWLDATCFLSEQIPENRFEYGFFSNKGAFSPTLNFKWTSFYMICGRNSVLANNMIKFFYRYWRDHNTILTYLILDCWMDNLYRYTTLSTVIDQMPFEGPEIFDKIMFECDSQENREKVSNYYVYKLSYKYQYPMIVDGVQSIFGRFYSSWKKQNMNL